MQKEVKIIVRGVLSAVTIFRQGGSLRLILPKKSFSLLRFNDEPSSSESSTAIVLETNKGILIMSLDDYLKDEELKMS